MEYVYGTAEIDGVMRENLKVIGGPEAEEGEYLTTVREYDDNTITDRCRIDRHYLTAEDEDGTKYDFYAISEHYRYIDRTKMLDETKAATEIAFVALAETGGIDGTTAGEHKNLFEEWQAGSPTKWASTGAMERSCTGAYSSTPRRRDGSRTRRQVCGLWPLTLRRSGRNGASRLERMTPTPRGQRCRTTGSTGSVMWMRMCGNPASAGGRRRKNEQPFADHR